MSADEGPPQADLPPGPDTGAGAILATRHLSMLRDGSGLSTVVIAARGYRTVTDAAELARLGFTPAQRRVPGLLLPGHAPDGSNGLYAYGPDAPRESQSGKPRKYEFPAGSAMRLDCPPDCRPALSDPAAPLWITEGQKKADALASRGLCAVALLGVWNFKGRNEHGGVTWLADWDYVALKGRDVRIVFDSDVMFKPGVRQALERLREHLRRKGAHVSAVYLPGGRDHKVGVDDFLLTHTPAELEALVDAPRPAPAPAAPLVELLDEAPAELRRPLALVGGMAYAAAWPYVRVTTTETLDRDGHVVRLDPPQVVSERRQFVVRSDGVTFGPGAARPLSDLGICVMLPQMPPADRLWSSGGVRSYAAQERPAPAEVFSRVVDVVDRFLDFNRSLADQRTMAEFVACYILSTWFLDAFTVIGFLWPNGERGSGKTQLLTIVGELGYLGQVILAGGSFAALRDLADYGATLCFDDAENLADPRKTDPDKRTLLLAGNRRGNTIPLKELAPDKTWQTRHVNTFCPRAFSAIRLPDPVLASRTITVPLIRTPDRARANSDPRDYKSWPHDRQRLIDDLWALGLAHLAELPAYEALVNERASLSGRNLEPWRAVLAVAAWLDERGVEGLWRRMEGLSVSYQAERQEFESGDLTVLVVRALCRCAQLDPADPEDINGLERRAVEWVLKTAQITDAARALAEELELDMEAEHITARRVGRTLGKMRLRQAKRVSARDTKGWRLGAEELKGWLVTLGLVGALPPVTLRSDESDPLSTNDTNDTNDTNVTSDPPSASHAGAQTTQLREIFEF